MKPLLLLLLFSAAGFAQNDNNAALNKQFYSKKDSVKIPIEQFMADISNYHFIEKKKQDSSITFKLVPKHLEGQLSPEAFEYLKKYLGSISGRELNENNTIVINYFPGEVSSDNPSKANIYDRDYARKLNRITDNEQFWVYSSDKNLENQHPKRINWIKDRGYYILNTFFSVYIPFGSFIVINKEGSFIKHTGEYPKDEVLEAVKALQIKN